MAARAAAKPLDAGPPLSHEPPAHLQDEAARASYRFLVASAPADLLRHADTALVTQAAILHARMLADAGGMTATMHQHLTRLLSLLGMCPTDRAKLSLPAAPEDKPVDRLAFLGPIK
ncbi:MAG TPA: hypothetical protein PKZ76_00950 [Xanthomonadaceae bacterium]|nr:hypothetical protein [Xanthomonadaceae bacterium]